MRPPSPEEMGGPEKAHAGDILNAVCATSSEDNCRSRGHASSRDHPFCSASRWLPFLVLAHSRYLSTATLRSSVESVAFTYTACRAPLMRHKPSLAIVLRWAL